MVHIIILLFASSLSLFVPSVLSAPYNESDYNTQANEITVERQVDLYFSDIPIMKDIARCESRFRHYAENGEVLRGEVVQSDIGVMQINEYYHSGTAERLGIDLYSVGGNMVYARYLFEKEGTTPWLSSAECWGKNNHTTKK